MNLTESTRAYVYRVLLALQPLVVGYGLLTDEKATLWISVASAVLGLGLATANTKTAPAETDEAGTVDVGLLFVVLTFVGVVLILFGVHLNK